MNEKKRRNAGVIGSALVHILIVLVISVTGLLHTSHVADDIVEVTFLEEAVEAVTAAKLKLL